MKLGSLKLRLMALAALWVVGSLAAAALVLQLLFITSMEREVRQDLEAAMTRLIALINMESPIAGLEGPLPDPRYDTPLGGRYWQIELIGTGQILRSRSLWDMTIPVDVGVENGLQHFEKTQSWHLVYVSRQVEMNERKLRVSVGEDHGPLHEAGAAFLWDVVRLFLVLGVLILVAAGLQLRLGLAPLNRLRQEIDQVRQRLHGRLEGDFPSEVQPLVDEVNALLQEREANVERARRQASDLAHGLKTPLAALHGIALRVREKGNEADADLVDDLSFEMSKRVDYQMRLTALRLRSSAHRESASLNTAVIRTITVLNKTGSGEKLHWLADLEKDCSVDIHRQDLMELVGVTLENAAKWAATRVVVRSKVARDAVQLEIIDDGPGVPDELLPHLGQRGQRLDETVPGDGLGLAIASEILKINRGEMAFRRAELGGLSVVITLPLTLP